MPLTQDQREWRPPSNYPKQAIVVIHGMGEQKPMDTIKGFAHAVWGTDREIAKSDHPDPAEIWSKPDLRTGSLELRRITTRQSVATGTFPKGVRSDFYELYWADLLEGSTWSHVKGWICGLLLRNPARVPGQVMPAWILLWVATLIILYFALASALPADATIFGYKIWDFCLLRWLAGVPSWLLGGLTFAFAWFVNAFVVPYLGDVVRYTQATPTNIAARKDARERGLTLLDELHKAEYDRIIIVAHSLGSVLAYDLISYFWSTRPQAYTVVQGSQEFEALRAVEWEARELSEGRGSLAAYQVAQNDLCALLRRRKRPAPGERDMRWLITDFVTVGCPLTHAEFLLVDSLEDLDERRNGREYPTSPPTRERLDADVRAKAQAAGLPLDNDEPMLFCFPFGDKWQLHHAAPFAVVRWTNIHDPARWVFQGDIISGPVAPVFGPGIEDIDLRQLRGQSRSFTHTHYWSMDNAMRPPPHVIALRKALDLAGKDRLL